MTNEKIENFIKNLPDEESARRFFEKLSKEHPSEGRRLLKNPGLLSDVLTLSAFSPLLAMTVLQNPGYISWLNRQRIASAVREKEELLESLARFALTNSQIEPSVMLSRFRRRELIRIYLKDIRGLGSISEVTEEISNLADSILEYALRVSRQELDNRYGIPLEVDEKNKAVPAKFCIVALGKLGSKELNYSSDIDLLFIYSKDGSTSGQGERGATTNREYFTKLAEFVTKLIGRQIGEGAAYRVDLRLRPHGRVGALAVSLREAENYYKNSARMWEKQVLIRSRAAAGDASVFQEFADKIAPSVFSADESVETALKNVRLSKQKIDLEKISKNGFDVKLGRGGIREIEFIAQALQLAFGGGDRWLRAPHTLISLSRLADRGLLTETELTQLFEAYDFLRRLEHRLQMENGLQTHLLPGDPSKISVVSKRMNFDSLDIFEQNLRFHTENVSRIFTKIFGEEFISEKQKSSQPVSGVFQHAAEDDPDKDLKPILFSIDKSDEENEIYDEKLSTLKIISEISPPFSEMLASNPQFVKNLPDSETDFFEPVYLDFLASEVRQKNRFAGKLAALRKAWARSILEIATFEIFEKIDMKKSRELQTKLAEASLETALRITENRLREYFQTDFENFSFAVLGLGKLGGGGMDYGSDLDLILVYDDEKPEPVRGRTFQEFYSKAVEFFVTTVSSLTREGALYRIDLRLRPDGKNGATSIGKTAFASYLENRSAVWEWLAYVKIRGVAGDRELAQETEKTARNIIHRIAVRFDKTLLREEALKIRKLLEQSKSAGTKGREIDIKYGEGGLQDIYFTVRYLQLRDNFPDAGGNRSTGFSLEKLFENESIAREHFENLQAGYEFISRLDHFLRLTVGRSTRLPVANQKVLQIVSGKMGFERVSDFLEKLTFHRQNVHTSFESILGD